jgi:hypothetical protein
VNPRGPDFAVELSRRLVASPRSDADSGDLHRQEALDRLDPVRIEGDGARKAFWLNVYNGALLRALAERPRSGHLFRHRRMFRADAIRIGGRAYSLDAIEHGLLRGNARPPYSLRRVLRDGDPRLAAAPSRPDPRIHFALNCGARSCPPIRPYSSTAVDEELAAAERAYLAAESTLDRERGVLELPGLLRLYRGDFGPEAELVSLAAAALGGEDEEWIAANSGRIEVRFGRFDWRLVPAKG